ncbi:MAG: FKBP-type peptidyl-prolyl cis-trans isomerase [Bacteroidales bacterium]|uniref:FKBP-type peptidyl-prolyl cis-trans isomerase n=1 Tax=Sodaliphilus sp. TaxID=2815818 RepID=UPI001B3EC421|nr:FKBP-type peptidyl-prolyl cis-trans isomerase [Candidatus Sodaliphilus limicaballi]
MDKLSYALGLSMAQNFIGSGIRELNADDFAAALKAVYNNEEKLMSYDEAKAFIQEFFTALEEENKKNNAEAGKKFLEENAKDENVKVTASGLQYLVVKEGDGIKPTATDAVTVHYTGRLIDGTVFDSSEERGEPATFGVGQVIPGWVEGLQLMSEGSAYRFFIPSELAYGPHGTGPIQPNSTLIFDVQLIKVQRSGDHL